MLLFSALSGPAFMVKSLLPIGKKLSALLLTCAGSTSVFPGQKIPALSWETSKDSVSTRSGIKSYYKQCKTIKFTKLKISTGKRFLTFSKIERNIY